MQKSHTQNMLEVFQLWTHHCDIKFDDMDYMLYSERFMRNDKGKALKYDEYITIFYTISYKSYKL
jgi:hypothetical protein